MAAHQVSKTSAFDTEVDRELFIAWFLDQRRLEPQVRNQRLIGPDGDNRYVVDYVYRPHTEDCPPSVALGIVLRSRIWRGRAMQVQVDDPPAKVDRHLGMDC